MQFLVDAQLPPALCGWLEAKGHLAEHVFGRDMIDASDARIAKLALDDAMILISKDEDFRILQQQLGFAFLWLRCGNTTKAALFDWMEPRWPHIEKLMQSGETMIEVR